MSKIEILEGDEITVMIEAVSTRGEGIARVDDHIVFVPNAKEDEEVKVKVNKVINKICFADLLDSSDASKTEEAIEEVIPNQSDVSPADLATVKEVDAVIGLEDAPIEAPRPEDFGMEQIDSDEPVEEPDSTDSLPPLPIDEDLDSEDLGIPPPPPVSDDELKQEDGFPEVPKPPQ